jgi:hypothetical protein
MNDTGLRKGKTLVIKESNSELIDTKNTKVKLKKTITNVNPIKIKKNMNKRQNSMMLTNEDRYDFKSQDISNYDTNLDYKFGGRKDAKGNAIIKGKYKKHHITFKDFSGRHALVDFVNIPKFKDDNGEMGGSHKKDEESVSCACLIF